MGTVWYCELPENWTRDLSTENCDTYHCAKEKPKIELQYCLKNLVIQQVYYNYSTYKLLIGNKYTNP